MANNTISQVEINGTTYDLLDANTLNTVSSLESRVTSLESSVVNSITRSGTTFTAKNSSGTQLFTFSQQDNNTTYGVATTSANGLMSSGDKSKLDKLKSFNDGKECHIAYWRNSNSDGGMQIKGITSDNKIITVDFTPGVIRLQLFNSLSGNAVVTKNWYPS